MNAKLIFDARARLGECPVWDAKTQSLYWLDILQKKMYVDNELFAEFDDLVGCFALCKNGHFILGKRASFIDFEPATGKETVLYSLNESLDNRINDGKCDPLGRFIAGTMDMKETNASGTLYSFDNHNIRALFNNVTISNGMAWSPDYKTFYYIDTPTREIKAFEYDVKTGEIANPRVAIRIPKLYGWPDGMTSDAQGNLWIVLWGGSQITKWNPRKGELLEKISVPVLQPSSCVFGGENMNELFITSARKELSEVDLEKYPLSGGLFKIETDVEGMPMFEFG